MNPAAVVAGAPVLQENVAGIAAVMGWRPGHRFHPSEDTSPGAILFGPQVIGWRRPFVWLPCEVARPVELDTKSLDALAASSAAGAWVVDGSGAGSVLATRRRQERLLSVRSDGCRVHARPWTVPGCCPERVGGPRSADGPVQRARALRVAESRASVPAINPAGQGQYCAGLSGDLQRPWRLLRVDDALHRQ